MRGFWRRDFLSSFWEIFCLCLDFRKCQLKTERPAKNVNKNQLTSQYRKEMSKITDTTQTGAYFILAFPQYISLWFFLNISTSALSVKLKINPYTRIRMFDLTGLGQCSIPSSVYTPNADNSIGDFTEIPRWNGIFDVLEVAPELGNWFFTSGSGRKVVRGHVTTVGIHGTGKTFTRTWQVSVNGLLRKSMSFLKWW